MKFSESAIEQCLELMLFQMLSTYIMELPRMLANAVMPTFVHDSEAEGMFEAQSKWDVDIPKK